MIDAVRMQVVEGSPPCKSPSAIQAAKIGQWFLWEDNSGMFCKVSSEKLLVMRATGYTFMFGGTPIGTYRMVQVKLDV